jgi:RNA polymerase sporulation-specific sigma factor
MEEKIMINENMIKTEEDIFAENEGLIWHVVNRYFNKGEGLKKYGYDREDLFQMGSIGLVRAIRLFDKSRGTAFSTYAVPTIYGEIRKLNRENNETGFKIQRHIKELLNRIRSHGEITSAKHAVELFNCKLEDAEFALEVNRISHFSLDKEQQMKSGEQKQSVAEFVPDPHANTEKEVLRKVELEQMMATLTDRDKKIMFLSLEGKTQQEVAKIYGISQVQVSRIIKNSIKKMHKVKDAV